MIHYLKNLWFLVPILTLALTQSAKAAELCTANYLSTCSDLGSEECLQKYQACGEYNAIVQHFAAESVATSPMARFYKGVSYYGLFHRNRAFSLRCQYAKLAQQDLLNFIRTKRIEGFRDRQSFDQVYLAAKIVSELKTIEGCLDLGFTTDDVKLQTEEYADTLLKTLFIGTSQSGAVGDQIAKVKDSIQSVIGGFINTAAQIETQLLLRDVAMDASQYRLKSIGDIFANRESDGTLKPGAEILGNATANVDAASGEITSFTFELSPGSQFETAVANAQSWSDQVNNFQSRLSQALGTSNINDYEAARKKFVGFARDTRDKATILLNATTRLGGDNPVASSLLALLASNPSLSGAKAVIAKIKSDWALAGSLDCAFGDPKPWYCTTESAMFNAMPTQ